MFAKVFSISIDETPSHETRNAKGVTVHAHVAGRHVAYSAMAMDFGGITVGLSYHGRAERFADSHSGTTPCDGSCRGESDFRAHYLFNERLYDEQGFEEFDPEASWLSLQERFNSPWNRFQERFCSRSRETPLKTLQTKGRLFRHTFEYGGDSFTNDWCFAGNYHITEKCLEMGSGSSFQFTHCDGTCRKVRIKLPDHVADMIKVELLSLTVSPNERPTLRP